MTTWLLSARAQLCFLSTYTAPFHHFFPLNQSGHLSLAHLGRPPSSYEVQFLDVNCPRRSLVWLLVLLLIVMMVRVMLVRVVVQVLTSTFNKVFAAAYDTPTAASTSTTLRGVRRRMLPLRPLRTPAYGETDTNGHYAERDPLVSESLCKILEPPHLHGRGWTGLHEAHLAQVGGMPRGDGAQQVPLEVVHQDVVPQDARLEAQTAPARGLVGSLTA